MKLKDNRRLLGKREERRRPESGERRREERREQERRMGTDISSLVTRMERSSIIKFYILTTFSTILLSCHHQVVQHIENKNQSMQEARVYNAEEHGIFDQLKARDSLLFNLGFNQCDTMQIKQLVSEDFEFYHDQSGITKSKELFIRGISGLCHLNYKPTRELAKNSLEVYLLKNNGALYGAIQTGEHLFYGEQDGKPKYLTSTAKFTHLWIIEDGNWRLKRVLSYDHIVPENESKTDNHKD